MSEANNGQVTLEQAMKDNARCWEARIELIQENRALKVENERLSNPWVSVEDDLPDNWDETIISDGSSWWTSGHNYSDYKHIVTHWMPIPEVKE